MKRILIAAAALLVFGCSKTSSPKPEAAGSAAQPVGQSNKDAVKAALGQEAPNFTLTSVDGQSVSLKSFRGKTVVLEWFNPGCPFVKNAHANERVAKLAKRYAEKGIVWLAINSGAAGKQGHGAETNRASKSTFGIDYPILLDDSGRVGQSYDAKRTPHMYIVDPKGVLRYRGALDNSGSGDPEDANNFVNYVSKALDEIAAGKPVSTPETKAWGCSVKYASR